MKDKKWIKWRQERVEVGKK